MDLNSFYSIINEIRNLKYYANFHFYFHGGILNHGNKTEDIDVKIVPRSGNWAHIEIEKTLFALKELDIEATFMEKVYTWDKPLKPTLEEIDTLPAIRQAVIDKDITELLEFNKTLNPIYLYKGSMTYYEIGKMICYRASEWAIGGHKYNQSFKDMSPELKEWLLSNSGAKEARKYHNDLIEDSEVINIAPVELRELLERVQCNTWEEFKNQYWRPYK